MKPSRQRRKDAVNAAIEAVYKNKGSPYTDEINPYNDERCHRIFVNYYNQWRNTYHNMESICRDMEEIYGYIGAKK